MAKTKTPSTPKPEKRFVTYSEGYKKGVSFNEKGRSDLIKHIQNPATNIYIQKAGKYSDNKEFLVIKIDDI